MVVLKRRNNTRFYTKQQQKYAFCDFFDTLIIICFRRDMTIHQCETCHKNFKEKRELRNHVKRVHEGELDFLCDQCSRPFVDAYALKRHVANVHDVDKRFKCLQCDKGFGGRSHYNEHMIKVHEEGHKLTCEFCGKGKELL